MNYRLYDDGEVLHGDAELPQSMGMLDFWRVAFSDLLQDALS